MALGELGVGAFRSAVRELNGPEELLFESLGGVVVELLVRLGKRRERSPQLVDRARKTVEQLLPRFRGRVGHASQTSRPPGDC
jgi:hypothetical protein